MVFGENRFHNPLRMRPIVLYCNVPHGALAYPSVHCCWESRFNKPKSSVNRTSIKVLEYSTKTTASNSMTLAVFFSASPSLQTDTHHTSHVMAWQHSSATRQKAPPSESRHSGCECRHVSAHFCSATSCFRRKFCCTSDTVL